MPIVLSPQDVSFLRYLDNELKDEELEMDYLGRCYSYLEGKAARTDEEEKEFQRVLKKLKAVNLRITKLRNKREIFTRDEIIF